MFEQPRNRLIGVCRAHHAEDLPGLIRVEAAELVAYLCPGSAAKIDRDALSAAYDQMHMRGETLGARPDQMLTRDDAEMVLIANSDRLKTALDAATGREEIRVEIFWDPDAVLDRYRDAPELSQLSAHVIKTRGAAYMAAIDALQRRLSDSFAATLRRYAEDCIALPHPDGTCLVSLACLTRRNGSNIREAVAEIRATWPEGLRIIVHGPAPATTFHAMELLHIMPSDVASAAALLRLNEVEATSPRLLRNRARATILNGNPTLQRDAEMTRAVAAVAQARDLLMDRLHALEALSNAGYSAYFPILVRFLRTEEAMPPIPARQGAAA